MNESRIKKESFHIPGYSSADVEVSTYTMKNIPSFREEKYMLSKNNYISGLAYELKEMLDFRGVNKEFTKTWEDVDDEFKKDRDSGGQLKYSSFFKNELPPEILEIADEMERARAVYKLIQKKIKWDGSWHIFNEVRVKNAYETGVGNNSEINLALINALKAANIAANLVLIATRNNGIPTESYPVMNDFNHSIALVTIDDQPILLDAMNKFTPFGMLPFNDLNIRGRVMDFKQGSYWIPLSPYTSNMHYINASLKALDNGGFEGSVNEVYSGYLAVEKRAEIEKNSEQQFINKKEALNPLITITKYQIEHLLNIDIPLKNTYTVTIAPEVIGDKILFSPYFFESYFSSNPFTLEERNFPVELGFPITNTYLLQLDLNGYYSVENIPENKIFQLGDGDVECSVIYQQAEGKINFRFTLNLKSYQFAPDNYKDLKQLFGLMIDLQQNDTFVLKTTQ